MALTRRDFIHAGYAVGAVTLVPNFLDRAHAGINNPGSGGAVVPTGRKAQINFNISANDFDYPLINAAPFFGAFGARGTPGVPFNEDPFALLTSDGYPTTVSADMSVWSAFGSIYYNGIYATFAGSVTGTTLTVSGSVTGTPLAIGQTVRGTGITAGTRIISGSGTSWQVSQSMSATGSITITATIPWVITWTGNAGVTLGVGGNGLVTTTTVSIGSNRIEYHMQPYAGAVVVGNLSGSVLAVTSFSSGSSIPTLGALNAAVTGVGMPPYTCLEDAGGGGGTGNYFIVDVAGGAPRTVSYTVSGGTFTIPPTTAGVLINASINISSVTTTPGNIQVFRQDEEALLNAGQLTTPHFQSFYNKYGRFRFLNWAQTNGNMQAQWIQRPLTTNFSWAQNNVVPALYGGRATQSAGTNDYSAPNAISYTDTSGNVQTNPSSWTQGMMLQTSVTTLPFAWCGTATVSGNTLTVVTTQFGALAIGLQVRAAQNGAFVTANITAGSGSTWTIDGSAQTFASATTVYATVVVTGFSNANPAQVTAVNHGFSTGAVICFTIGELQGGTWEGNINGGIQNGLLAKTVYTITVVDANHFTLNGVDSTTWGTWTSGGTIIRQIRFKSGALPYKQVTGQFLQSPFSTVLANLQYGLITLVYDADLDVLIMQPPDFIGRGLPIETACQVCNECGADLWLSAPMYATDNFVTQMATTIKANLNPAQKWCFELANEVWNTAPGFWQSVYSQYKAYAQFPGLFTNTALALYSWYGYRFFQMVTLVNTIYSGADHGKCVRILGFKADDFNVYASNPSAIKFALDGRTKPSGMGLAATPVSLADQFCFATYWGNDFTSSANAAQNIGNYQQGILTGNASMVNTAIANADTAFTSGTGSFGLTQSQTLWSAALSYMSTVPSSIPMTAYEGGFSVTPNIWLGGSNNPISPSSYLGIPFNAQDQLNLWTAYQASSNYGTSFATFLAAWKAAGGVYFSQYQSTSNEAAPGSMWALRYNIFGPTNPGETSFNAYNAS